MTDSTIPQLGNSETLQHIRSPMTNHASFIDRKSSNGAPIPLRRILPPPVPNMPHGCTWGLWNEPLARHPMN